MMAAECADPHGDELGSRRTALRRGLSKEEKAARREARRQEIERDLEKEFESADKIDVGPRERVLPLPRPPPPVPKATSRIVVETIEQCDNQKGTEESVFRDKPVWGRRSWSPVRECTSADGTASNTNMAAELGADAKKGYQLDFQSPAAQREWEEGKAQEQKAKSIRNWKAAAVEREEVKAQEAKAQRERERAAEDAANEARTANLAAGGEALLRAAEALRSQRTGLGAEAENRCTTVLEDDVDDAIARADQQRKEQLELRLMEEESRWAEQLEEERRLQEQSHAEWLRDREKTMDGVKIAMSAIERKRLHHAECTRRDMARLDRLVEERRRDLEEHLRRWAEQHERAAEAQSVSSAAFVRNFRSTFSEENEPPRQDSEASFRAEPPPYPNKKASANHFAGSASRPGRKPFGPGTSPNPPINASMTQRRDPLQAAMCEVATRLREAVDLPADKRKAVLADLRLKWHPDKNPENVEVATKVFQFMQELKEKLWA